MNRSGAPAGLARSWGAPGTPRPPPWPRLPRQPSSRSSSPSSSSPPPPPRKGAGGRGSGASRLLGEVRQLLSSAQGGGGGVGRLRGEKMIQKGGVGGVFDGGGALGEHPRAGRDLGEKVGSASFWGGGKAE
ncbi:hypothetical protein LUU34_01262000 [Aix galericulata]|nr:hypothetical protein LUU34_01262000 [Aix galericulata]